MPGDSERFYFRQCSGKTIKVNRYDFSTLAAEKKLNEYPTTLSVVIVLVYVCAYISRYSEYGAVGAAAPATQRSPALAVDNKKAHLAHVMHNISTSFVPHGSLHSGAACT